MKIRTLSVLLCTVVALAPLSLFAAPVLRSGETITVNETQEVPNDFYAAGGTVTVSGKITGDLYAAGGTITINGEITGDAVIAGGSVHIDGPVGDDIRVTGGELVISDTVKGDVLVVGGVVRILSTAHIDGDLLFLGGEVDMDGDLRGSLSGKATTVRVNGPVLGNISVTTDQALELGDQAHIEGTISYKSNREIVRAPGSVVTGDITRTEVPLTSGMPSFSILPLLALFFTTLVYLLLCRVRLERLMRHTMGAFGWYGLLGLGVLVVTPLVATILMVSAIGLPIGLALLLFYMLLVLVGISLGGIFVGAVLSRYFDDGVTLSLKWALLGTLIFGALAYIPFIGSLLAIVISLIIMGGISSLIYARIRT